MGNEEKRVAEVSNSTLKKLF